MKTKEQSTKEVLAEAKQEVFDGKSVAVKNHFLSLLGKRDGIKARLATTVSKIEAELESVEATITAFSELNVEDAYNEIMAPKEKTVLGNSINYVYSTGDGYPVMYRT